VRERDLVGRESGFIAEGSVVLEKAVQSSRHALASILISEKRIKALEPVLARLEEGTPVYCAAQPVLDAIAGYHLHRGVLALGRRVPEPTAEELLASLGPRALVVGLFGSANHDNVGGVFRNAAAFGADAVLLDAECCDPLYRKAIRVSVGASLITPFARLDPKADPLELLDRHGFETLALSPRGEVTLSDYRPGKARVAALFGAEGPGLATEILARARTVSIPMAHGFDSLNLATASGIVLHHLTR
jgi:tRNA G18 (ribose-2'-O)-methylase SpoU